MAGSWWTSKDAWETKGKGKGVDDAFSGTALATRCYESHPVLKIGKGRLYGGSAAYPVVKDADIYVALQNGSTCGRISDPWEKQRVVEVQYSIRDMEAPSNLARFKKMITWLCTQLHEGKTVHVGCIGGHGRTGTVFSAIVAEALEQADAIQYVRTHYCKKAVESQAQVTFLMKHYGVTTVEPTKGQPKKWESSSVRPVGTEATGVSLKDWEAKRKGHGHKVVQIGLQQATSKSYAPLASARSLWKPKKDKA